MSDSTENTPITRTPIPESEAVSRFQKILQRPADEEAPEGQDGGEELEQEQDDQAAEGADDKDSTEDPNPDDAEDGDEGAEDPDDGEEQTEADEASEDPKRLYTVTIDGKEEKVTLQELKNGYSGRRFIDQEINRVRSFEAELKKTARERYFVGLQVLEDRALQFDSVLKTFNDSAAMRELAEKDPAEYQRITAQAQERKKVLDEIYAARHRETQEVLKEQQNALVQAMNESRENLYRFKPEWKNSQTWNKDWAMITDSLRADGFTDSEIKEVFDSRIIKKAYYAALYEQGLKKAKGIKEKAPSAKRVLSSKQSGIKAGPRDKVAARMQELKRTRSEGAALSAFEAIMASKGSG